jgi:diketogulonate reductase-like aldo/keto reductase
VVLRGGVRMPTVGLGTAGLRGGSGYAAIRTALDAGYRMLDTATAYGNEAEVGRAVRDSGRDVFVTTKLPPSEAGHEAMVLDASMRALGVDAVDLWLIHWPPSRAVSVRAWSAMLAARDSGRVRAVGVSNYGIDLIDSLIRDTGEPPAVNQIPWSPGRHEPAVLAESRERGVIVEGYSPLSDTDLDDPTLVAIAFRHGVTAAQVVLRWHLQHGIVVIPKSTDAGRQRANRDLDGFALTPDEMATLDAF